MESWDEQVSEQVGTSFAGGGKGRSASMIVCIWWGTSSVPVARPMHSVRLATAAGTAARLGRWLAGLHAAERSTPLLTLVSSCSCSCQALACRLKYICKGALWTARSRERRADVHDRAYDID